MPAARVRPGDIEPVRSRSLHMIAMAALVALVPARASMAQSPSAPRRDPDAFVNQQRTVDERVRRDIDEQLGASAHNAFDWGGWYSSYLFLYDDGVESSRTFRRSDLRVWGRLTLDDGAHEFYVRPRASYLDFNSGDSYDGNDNDLEGPNLERGYYRLDLARAFRGGTGARNRNLLITIGRDVVRFGNGVTLSAPLDHVSLLGTIGDWSLEALAGRSVGSTQEFDLSRSATRSHRDFLGAQLRYRRPEKHDPFLYVLYQKDRNSERTWRPLQRFDYDSLYTGIGSTGELVRRLRYETEFVIEAGESYGDRRFLKPNDILAYAFQAQLEYLFPGERRTRASVEYLFGSGDGDRVLSPTNSIGGNTRDFDDSGFVAFGFRDTGLAFAPRYSNLHMWRAGGSFYPWPKDRLLAQLELGADAYLFHKHHGDGAVSDPTADLRSGYLGWEVDCYANWQVTHDLAWTTRLGAFFPGSAFDDRTTRTFLLMGMTWSF